MKLKSLILGSVAAAGLSTAGFAADLGVLTSLDVCDALGLSGLTISSDTNCLQISGGVSYEFRYGDFRAATPVGYVPFVEGAGLIDRFLDDEAGEDENMDWHSKVTAWLKFVGTADSDFGPASATVKIKQVEAYRAQNETYGGLVWGDNEPLQIDEAYVSIGDSTVIMVGKKGSIANFGDSDPFNFLDTFGYSEIDTGILFQNDEDEDYLGGHVIQVVSDLGNGVSVGVGLENLDGQNGTDDEAGNLVGVLSYAGENLTAHLTALAFGVLDGEVDSWAVHAGATGTFDAFQVRGAVGYAGVNDIGNELHALLSAKATFDMFTIALSGEYMRTEDEVADVVDDGFGFGGSIGANVTDGVAINLGARYFSADFESGLAPDNDTLQIAAQLVAAVTETIKVTGEVGAYFNEDVLEVADEDPLYYGALELAWAPGGGFTSSIKGEVGSNGGYRATFKAAKTFE